MPEYRDDDQTVGYCPKCGSRLTTVNVDAIGYCGLHGWVPAEWDRPALPQPQGHRYSEFGRGWK